MLNSPRSISDCYRIDLANGETAGEIGIAVKTVQRGHILTQFPEGVIK